MKKFHLICANDPDEFSDKVSKFLDKGYEREGHLIYIPETQYDHQKFMQTMVKPEVYSESI